MTTKNPEYMIVVEVERHNYKFKWRVFRRLESTGSGVIMDIESEVAKTFGVLPSAVIAVNVVKLQ